MFKGEMHKYSLSGLNPVYNNHKVQYDDTKLFTKNDKDDEYTNKFKNFMETIQTRNSLTESNQLNNNTNNKRLND